MLVGKNTSTTVGVVVGLKVFGSVAIGEGFAVGTVVGLNELVTEGAGIALSAGGPIHVLVLFD